MASLLGWLKYSGARKNDGTPVSSGTVNFYQPGTTTAATVYSDADGLITLPQPVALDAGGRARVYVKAAVKAEVKDATGVSVALEDRADTVNASQVEIEQAGITGTSLTTGLQVDGGRTDLQTVLSGFSATYKESASATSRSYAAAIGLYVTPQDFGALGNDAADDTAAFQAAVTRAAVSGKPLFIPPGTYRIYSTITIATSGLGLRVIGANRDASLIRNMGALTALSVTGYDVSLENFTITSSGLPSSTGVNVAVSGSAGCVISRVTVLEHGTGFSSLGAPQVTFEDCYATLTVYNGNCYVLGPYAIATGCRARTQYGVGFRVTGPYARVAFGYAYAWSTGAVGYRVDGNDNTVMASTMETLGGSGNNYGFQVDAVARTWIVACTSTNAAYDLFVGAAATFLREVGNNFAVRYSLEASGADWFGPRAQVFRRVRNTYSIISSGSAQFSPDLTVGELQVAVIASSSSSPITLIINAPSPTVGVADGQCLHFIIENNAAAACTLTWNAAYRIAGSPAYFTSTTLTLIPGVSLLSVRFIYRAATSLWVPLPFTSATINTGASAW